MVHMASFPQNVMSICLTDGEKGTLHTDERKPTLALVTVMRG